MKNSLLTLKESVESDNEAAATRIEDLTAEYINALKMEHTELKNREKALQRMIKATGAENRKMEAQLL